jgi:hypothetical protein
LPEIAANERESTTHDRIAWLIATAELGQVEDVSLHTFHRLCDCQLPARRQNDDGNEANTGRHPQVLMTPAHDVLLGQKHPRE